MTPVSSSLPCERGVKRGVKREGGGGGGGEEIYHSTGIRKQTEFECV